MVHAEGAPTNGPGGGETDFDSFSLEQLQAMIAQANPSTLGKYAEKLNGTARRIQTATEGLSQCIKALDGVWEGPSADSFRAWAGGLTAAASGLGDYVAAAGNHVNHVGQQIFVAKARMPARMDPAIVAKANQGPVATVSLAVTTQAAGGPPPGGVDPVKAQQEAKAQVDAAHREAVAQMRMLASTYRVTAQDLKALPPPAFPDPPGDFQHDVRSLGGPTGSSGGQAGGGRGTSQSRAGTGHPSSGIYSAPRGSAPNGGGPGGGGPGGGATTGLNTPYAPQPTYVPQSTNLQGNGSLTAPDTTANAPWMPQVSGGGPGSVNAPNVNGPGVVPSGGSNPFSGTYPSTNVSGGPGLRGGGGSTGSTPLRGGVPGTVPGGSGVSPRGSNSPGTGGGRGSFSAHPEGRNPNTPGTNSPSGANSSMRPGGMPGSPGSAGAPGSPSSNGGASRRLAASRGGSVGNASGTASNRNSPRLRALPVEGSNPASEATGSQSSRRSPGQRTPFTGGARSEQVRRRTPRAEEDDDNVWDGPRRPGVVPPVID